MQISKLSGAIISNARESACDLRKKNGVSPSFDTGGARPNVGQLQQDFKNFSPAGVTSPFVARMIPTGGGASVMSVGNERAGVCQPCDCLSLFVSCLASEP